MRPPGCNVHISHIASSYDPGWYERSSRTEYFVIDDNLSHAKWEESHELVMSFETSFKLHHIRDSVPSSTRGCC